MKRYISLFVVIMFLFSPIYGYGNDDIDINAKAVLLLETETGNILYEKNVEEQMPPASITKLMTYLLVMESVDRGEVQLNDKVKISNAAETQRGATYFLRANEEILLSELIEVMMIVSANDTATAIAEHVGGSVEAFVERMNVRAADLGLRKTIFVNPTGMPEKGGGNISSANDLGILASFTIEKYGDNLLALTNKEFYSNQQRNFYKDNTNGLLKVIEEVDGLKTGFTNEAGYCLISTMVVKPTNENERDFRLLAIVLGTDSENDRTEESKKLLEYGRDNYQYKKILEKGEKTTVVYPWGMDQYPINLVVKDDVWAFGPKKGIIKNRLVETMESRFFPVSEGEKLGTLELTLYNDEVVTIEIISDKSIRSFPFTVYIKIFIMSTMELIRNLLFLK